jgi:hypothetical protein
MKTFSKYIIDKLLECRHYIIKEKPVVTVEEHLNSQIIAIGDIHGDIELMINTLTIGGVIEETYTSTNSIELNNKGKIKYYKWSGGNKVVVQVGDQIDRCRPSSIFHTCDMKETTYEDEASDIEILLFFTKLHVLAVKEHGAVYSLLGNHELMNSYGDINYVSYENLQQIELADKDLKNVSEKAAADSVFNEIGNDKDNDTDSLKNRRKHIFRRGGILSNFLACTRSSILIVNNYLFVHGGVFGSFINKLNNTNNKYDIFIIINDVVKQWLMNNDDTLYDILNDKYNNNNLYYYFFKKYNYNINHFIAPSSSYINGFINTIDSPFWIRRLGNIKKDTNIDKPSCKEVKKLIDHFNLNGIIVGHTPQLKGGINGTCSDKLYRIDVASSKAFYYILNDTLLPAEVLQINEDNTKKIIKR